MNQKHLEMITQLRHSLHAHPELSMEEHWTKETLMQFIKDHTNLYVEDRGHWFYACYHCAKSDADAVDSISGGTDTVDADAGNSIAVDAIAFRADFDALPIPENLDIPYNSTIPGVSHKCGHDGHSAALAGLALELEEKGADRDIYLIFQHAEEIGGGGEDCAALIPEKGIRAAFAFHNMSRFPEYAVAIRSGVTQCASKGFTVTMTGSHAHASQPEDGKNPAAAISELALAVQAAAAETCYDGMVLATIVQINVGSKNFGIAASKGEISMTLRACYEKDMVTLEQKIRQKAEILAARDGLTIDYTDSDVFPETVNDPAMVDLVKKAAAANNLSIEDMPEPFRGSEDFGYYLKQCPGAIYYIGNGTGYQALHTCEYDFNDRILEPAVDLFMKIVDIYGK